MKEKLIPVVMTTDSTKRGVFFGYINPGDKDKEVLEAKHVQMAVYWSRDVQGVIGLTVDGPSKHCKITKAAPTCIIRGVTLVSTVSTKAEKNWKKAYWAA